MDTLLPLKSVLSLTGLVRTTKGGSSSRGPPEGLPMLAHEYRRAALKSAPKLRRAFLYPLFIESIY